VLPSAKAFSPEAKGSEIVQENISDCSVVAALIVSAEHHARFGSKVRSFRSSLIHRSPSPFQLSLNSLFPQDSRGLPQFSPSGLYNVRLLFNGIWRNVSAYQLFRSEADADTALRRFVRSLPSPSLALLTIPIFSYRRQATGLFGRQADVCRIRGTIATVAVFAREGCAYLLTLHLPAYADTRPCSTYDSWAATTLSARAFPSVRP
jgi:hypothetical protein